MEISNTSISPGSSVNNCLRIKVTLTNEYRVDIKIYEITQDKRILVRNLYNEVKPGKSVFQIEWDGTNDNGDVVDNGEYEVELILSDVAKPFRAQTLKKKVYVETHYIIEEFKFYPSPFSPSRESANVLFQLAKNADATLTILDSGSNVVAGILNNKKMNKGSNTVSWDGRNSEGKFLAAGAYTAKLEISASGKKEDRKLPFRIVEGIEIKNLTLTPEKINPEGMNKFTLVSFAIDRQVEYGIRVFNANGAEVYNSGIVEGVMGENSIAWGGLKKVKFKTNVHYKVTIRKRDKNSAESKSEIIRHMKTIVEEMDGKNLGYTHDKGNPVVYSKAKSEDASSTLDELKQSIQNINADIVEAEIDRVEILYATIQAESLPSGRYNIEVNAKDPVTKQTSASKTISVTIDLEKPFSIKVDEEAIAGVNKKKEFYPKDISSTTDTRYAELVIPFELTKDANVKVQILSRKGGIETQTDMGRVLAGPSQARWNGMDRYSKPVVPGEYVLRLQATDTILLKKPKTIEYNYFVTVKEMTQLLYARYSGTNEFYTFKIDRNYGYTPPVITSNDAMKRLVDNLDKNSEDADGVVVIDFGFSEPVSICSVVMQDVDSGTKKNIIQRSEWKSILYSDEKNCFRWKWDGKMFGGTVVNPYFSKYGIDDEFTGAEEFVKPGLYEVWLFAAPVGPGNEAILKKLVSELLVKKQVSVEELQDFLNKNLSDKNVILKRMQLKGLGVFTEIAIRLDNAINKGLGEFLNFLTR